MADSAPSSTHRLTVFQKLAYGSASFVDTWPVWVPITLASPILTIQFGITPWIVSLLFMGFRLWDAITDPVMGWISDNTHTRWGRRRPYILIGALLIGLFFPTLWFFPEDSNPSLILVWISVSGLLLYTSLTIWAMPYHSLYLELTADFHERTRINAYRFLCGLFFSLAIGWSWWFTQLDFFADPETGEANTLLGAQYLTVLMGVVIALLGVLPAIFIKERFADSQVITKRKKTSLYHDIKLTLSNRNFLILVLVTVFFVAANSLVNSFGQFILGYYVMEGDLGATSTINGLWQTLSTVGVLFGIISASWISPKIGKRTTMGLAIGLQIIGHSLTWFVLVPGQPNMALVNPFIIGFGMQATWLLVGSMVADITDEDELITGNRREGSFSAMYAWVVKMSFTLGFGLSGPLLELTGFNVDYGIEQPDAFFWMKLLMTLLPVSALLIALVSLRYYGITEKTAVATRAQLEARRGVI